MKEFLVSVKGNLSNIFSIIGILLTVYFSIFYVPQYVNELENKKIETAHESLIETIQELVYNNHKIDQDDIKTLILGKELKGKIVYPFTENELLIQVQVRFIENKFIPLDQRKSLVEKIDLLRSSLVESNVTEKKEVKDIRIIITTVLVATLGLIVSIFGTFSLWGRVKDLKEMEIQGNIEERKEEIKFQVKESISLEGVVLDAVHEVAGTDNVKIGPPKYPIDFIVETTNGKKVGIEVKYTETNLIPLKTIDQLISLKRKLWAPTLLIANAPLSRNAFIRLNSYNIATPNSKIEFLNLHEVEDYKEYIRIFISENA